MADQPGKKPDPDELIPIGGEPAEELTQPISTSMSSVFNASGVELSSDALASLTDVLISEQSGEGGAAAPPSDVADLSDVSDLSDLSPSAAGMGEVELPPGLGEIEPPPGLLAPPADASAPPAEAEWGETALVAAPGKEAAEAEKGVPPPAEKKGLAGRLAAHPKLAKYLEWSVPGGAALVLLLVSLVHLIFFSTALYLIGLLAIGHGLWLGRKTSTVYTVFLGGALAAVVTVAYVLWLELGQYQFDIKARTTATQVSLLVPAQSRPVKTTAATWRRKV